MTTPNKKTKSQQDCPYCHLSDNGDIKPIISANRFDGDADTLLDYAYIDLTTNELVMSFVGTHFDSDLNAPDDGDIEHRQAIHFCPMCNRQLEVVKV